MDIDFDNLHFTDCNILKWNLTSQNELILYISNLGLLRTDGRADFYKLSRLTFYEVHMCKVLANKYQSNGLDLDSSRPYVIEVVKGDCDSALAYFVEGVDNRLNAWTEWDICSVSFALDFPE